MRKHLRKSIDGIPRKHGEASKLKRLNSAYTMSIKMLEEDILGSKKPQKISKLRKVDFAVQMVNPSVGYTDYDIVLGKFFPPDGVLPARMVIYRAPLEERFSDVPSLCAGILDVIRPPVLSYLKIKA
ncbi:MAG: hypothetical protein LBC50_00315 [Candidatus Ancillula sp.]|jgi:hypothetical protein|nr:hypothetical protein [Candidatus Ancillula sp.]